MPSVCRVHLVHARALFWAQQALLSPALPVQLLAGLRILAALLRQVCLVVADFHCTQLKRVKGCALSHCRQLWAATLAVHAA